MKEPAWKNVENKIPHTSESAHFSTLFAFIRNYYCVKAMLKAQTPLEQIIN